MRTNEQWQSKVYPKILEQFSPRLREDIVKYKIPKDLPEYGSYYLFGATSSGKTVMAAQMFIMARKKQYFERIPGRFLFINFYDFFLELQRGFDDPEEDEHQILEKYSTAEYLVLDDVASVNITPWGKNMFQILLNNRYENLLTTVITSNLDIEELAIYMSDERTASRIRRVCKKTIKLT